MSDNLKVANGDFESVWVNFTYVDMHQCAELFWKAGIASRQAAHDAEIARLKEEMVECEQRGAVKALEEASEVLGGYAGTMLMQRAANIRATSKKAG